MIIRPFCKILILATTLTGMSGCATYYAKRIQYEAFVQEGKLDQAEEFLNNDRFLARDKNQLLQLFERGRIAHLAGRYEESNRYFNRADSLIENYHINAGLEVLSFLTNPELTTYKPEDFEKVAIHWYKALNNIYLNNFENARVEARRINLRLQQINDQYKENKNRYASDALATILVGMIFEAIGETDNAFVFYRNAYELFSQSEGDQGYMGVTVPDQLKHDLVRLARINGYASEADFYQRRFQLDPSKLKRPEGGEVILFVENGMGPYKDQLDIFFTLVKGKAGFITFNNEDLGLTLPVYLGNDYSPSQFSDLKVVRIAFPQYKSRNPVFEQFTVRDAMGGTHTLELVEDYDAIAKQCLKDRFLREAGQALLRLAVKQASEIALRQEDETAGALLGLANALTEKADTRNWQTLPSRIYYRRIPLQPGQNTISVVESGAQGQPITTEYQVEGNGRLQFIVHYSLESYLTPTEYNYGAGAYSAGYQQW